MSTTSPMPSYKDTLTPAELADLLAYLMSLEGMPDRERTRSSSRDGLCWRSVVVVAQVPADRLRQRRRRAAQLADLLGHVLRPAV